MNDKLQDDFLQETNGDFQRLLKIMGCGTINKKDMLTTSLTLESEELKKLPEDGNVEVVAFLMLEAGVKFTIPRVAMEMFLTHFRAHFWTPFYKLS